MTDIRDMTDSEIYTLIFGSSESTLHVPMPLWIAEQVIYMPHLCKPLKDWAWETISIELHD